MNSQFINLLLIEAPDTPVDISFLQPDFDVAVKTSLKQLNSSIYFYVMRIDAEQRPNDLN